jgi:transmembrane 9 superfamily protein 3
MASEERHMLTRSAPPRIASVSALAAAVLSGLFAGVSGDENTQRYSSGEEVILWANKIGPYENPQETYSYFTLPLCAPKQQTTRWSGLGEALEGNMLVRSDYTILFAQNHPTTTLCTIELGEQAQTALDHAVSSHYWANMVLDELPIWFMLGEAREGDGESNSTGRFLFTHKHFSIAYNKDRLIEVNMTNDNPVKIERDAKLQMTYEVEWHSTTKPFSHRFHRYLDQDFFEHQIHWFSIFNSFMMVIFLVGLVGLILMRTLKSDLHRYSRHLDEEDALGDAQDDTGWKQVTLACVVQPHRVCSHTLLLLVG